MELSEGAVNGNAEGAGNKNRAGADKVIAFIPDYQSKIFNSQNVNEYGSGTRAHHPVFDHPVHRFLLLLK